MKKFIAALSFLFSSVVHGSEIYGKYVSESTIGLGLFGGHILEIKEKEYVHQMTTDILCDKSDPSCHLNKAPYKPYRGEYTLDGNKITFNSNFLDEKTYYYVEYRKSEMLLTESEKFAFDQARRLPPVVLRKVSKSTEPGRP